MGCDVVVGANSRRTFDRIVKLFEDRDRIFSRFCGDSELNRVNRATAEVVQVSPQFARAAARAVAAARRTGGLVDPTVGAALAGAGYDVDFDELVADSSPAVAVPPSDWRTVVVGDKLLRRPPGTQLDLNGVVKAMAVDDAVGLLEEPGFVSAGGDLAARATPVLVSLPDGERVTLARGGIATSGTAKRRWVRGGRIQHHLIDPRSGVPARSPWAYVTAVGETCAAADVAAKAALLLGEAGPEWLDAYGVAGRFAKADGRVVENSCWTRTLRREVPG
jgi:thiamine biosynthesis lipoprotein